MKSRTFFVFITFFLILFINKITLHSDLKKQNKTLSVVNISGRQRMYSQKINKLALIYAENSSRLNKTNLKLTLNNFKEAHLNLKNDLNSYENELLNTLFTKIEPSFKSITSNVDSLLIDENFRTKSYLNNVNLAANNFLPRMNEIVNTFEKIGKNKGEIILQREQTFNLVLIGLALYSVFFLILPLVKIYNKTKDLSV